MNITAFKENIMRRLGYPVHNVEITDDQINICINDAIDYYTLFNDDGNKRGLQFLDLISGTNEYTLDSTIEQVVYYIAETANSGLPTFRKLYGESLLFSSPNLDLISFAMTNSYLRLTEQMLSPRYEFVYDRHLRKLTFLTDILDNKTVVLYVFKNMSNEDLERTYDDIWFQKYVSSLCKYQWSVNISKYNKPMLGGATFNYELIMNEAKEEMEKLKIELREERESQPMFFIG